ncbi:MAG: hypothetical protein K6G10_01550 [Butyrivibrio sp.]|nr:hypothetical protein [Butyrivibrio sp.]
MKYFVFDIFMTIAGISAAILVFTSYMSSYAADDIPLPARPMISREARGDYENSVISRETAMSRINNQLDSLLANGHIENWEYQEASGRYEVTMNGGTVFAYSLN